MMLKLVFAQEELHEMQSFACDSIPVNSLGLYSEAMVWIYSKK